MNSKNKKMSKKQAIVNRIKYAKTEHKRWVTYAEAKFNGLELSDKIIPNEHTKCECGKWILNNGQILFHIKSSQALSNDHREFHKLYKKLYDFMENKKKGNIFNKSIIQKKNEKVMMQYANTLRNLSDNILLSFDNTLKEIEETPDDKINSLYNS